MFDDEVYEVTRDEFKGFMDELKPDCFDYEEYGYVEDDREIKITSKDGKRHFASIKSYFHDEDEIINHHYIYEMPHEDERQASKVIRKITLGSKEDVQAFFEILNKLQGEKKNE